jgi:tight adherence protein B
MSGTAGLVLIPLLFMVCFGMLAYGLLLAFREGMEQYSSTYSQDTARQFEDLFLFIPAKRIADLARLSAVAVFVLFYMLFGDLATRAGIVRGLAFAAAGAVLALNAPRILLAILRSRRIARFNIQLVDSLVGMSSALKAGFSILQAFETIVKQNLNPISQEFSLFLQQVRVGVKFEDALHNMEERVGSEDLLLMNQSIEIARMTGGNLTEVFEKIASTIRERMRIQQRIRSLTAQGRLQGIVVGSMPVALLFLMTMVDAKMMMAFFASKVGIGLIVMAGVLVLGGALIIRKIVDIKI